MCLGQTQIELHTLFAKAKPKTIRYPTAHPRIAEIREYPHRK